MKNTFVLFVLILVGLTGLPVQADAQGGYGNRHEMEAAARRGGAYPGGVYNRPGGYGYGGYVDPIYEPYIQQMMRLPPVSSAHLRIWSATRSGVPQKKPLLLR